MIMQITPSYDLTNVNLGSFLINVHSYKNLSRRIHIDLKSNKKLNIDPQSNISFEILLTSKKIEFYYIIDDKQVDLFKNEFNICYSKAIYKEQSNDYLKGFRIDNAVEFQLKNHFFMSLKWIRGENSPSILYLNLQGC